MSEAILYLIINLCANKPNEKLCETKLYRCAEHRQMVVSEETARTSVEQCYLRFYVGELGHGSPE